MATKLKNLKITSVDLVDRGANQEAYVELYKRDTEHDSPFAVTKADTGIDDDAGFLKNLFTSLKKRFEKEDKEGSVEKGTFDEELLSRKRNRLYDEVWDVVMALQSALCTALTLPTVAETDAAMQEAIEEFNLYITDAKEKWLLGESAILKKDVDINERFIDYSVGRFNTLKIEKSAEGGQRGVDPMIDVTKMSAGERAFYEEIVKKYSADGTTTAVPADGLNREETAPVEKAVAPAADGQSVEVAAGSVNAPAAAAADPYEGLNPVVKAEIDALRKRADEAETKELTEIAKRYEIIGKKTDELVPILKALKASDEKAYTEMISIMDASVQAVEKSALFSEVGRSGHGTETEAEGKARAIAKSYVEKDPTLSMESAMARAWHENPELLEQYDAEY